MLPPETFILINNLNNLNYNYKFFLKSPAKNIWKRIGTERRSGVVVPLFSVYSKESVGIGEIPDLKLIADWCVKTGMSIIQLLPLNESSGYYSPYSSISTFAIEPMYLRLSELKGIDTAKFSREINRLKSKYSIKSKRVDYRIRDDKIALLGKMYKKADKEIIDFKRFAQKNKYWLNDYAEYKILKEINGYKSWEEWKSSHSKHNKRLLSKINNRYSEKIKFFYWIQWQLYEQLKDVKQYAGSEKVLIMGDLPFLVSKDSADVWSHHKYFKLDKSAGSPPDMFFAFGQRWGMPPYNWEKIEKDNFKYIKERLRYAENFYDMFRIDHFVGLFRIWTFDNSSVQSKNYPESIPAGYDPPQRNKWEQHGKKIIKAMLSSSGMLPCAEDLGTVPSCSFKTLREYKLPGIDFQRYYKHPGKKNVFVKADEYRKNSSAVISTHDTSFFPLWWSYEAGKIDEDYFKYLCRKNEIIGKRYKEVRKKLFNMKLSGSGKLHWDNKIKSVKILTRILKLKRDDERKLVNLYNSSYKEKEKFMKYLYGKEIKPKKASPLFQNKCLEVIGKSKSIFSVQLIQEYLFLDKKLFDVMNNKDYRINKPGVVDRDNWSVRMPLPLEQLLSSSKYISLNKKILKINKNSDRI